MVTARDLRSTGRRYHRSKPSVWRHTGNGLWCVDCPCGFYIAAKAFRAAQRWAGNHTAGRPGDPRRAYQHCTTDIRWADRRSSA